MTTTKVTSLFSSYHQLIEEMTSASEHLVMEDYPDNVILDCGSFDPATGLQISMTRVYVDPPVVEMCLLAESEPDQYKCFDGVNGHCPHFIGEVVIDDGRSAEDMRETIRNYVEQAQNMQHWTWNGKFWVHEVRAL